MELILLAEIFITVFLLNANPVFTIPTWIVVLLFIGISDPIYIFPVLLIGISASTIGRYTLAWYSRKIGKTLLSKKQRKNIEYFKDFFISAEQPFTSFIIAFLYALSPLPTNTLFFIAGIAGANLHIIILGFFLGELLSGMIYISVLESTLHMVTFSNFEYILIGGIGILLAIIVVMIDWKKLIKTITSKEMERKAHEAMKEIYKD